MAANIYNFSDHWYIPFPIAEVWAVLSRPEEYPAWWRGVYLSATLLDNASPDGAGRRVAIVARGWLPYRLRFTIETLTLREPHLIEFKASGDFVTDASRWVLKTDGNGTHVTLEWKPRVEKPIVRFLSPILKPIFGWNHNWTMTRGEIQLAEYLKQKSTGQKKAGD